MRRFIAFLIMIFTMVSVFAINIISYTGSSGLKELQTDFQLGLDYKGGYEVLYTIVPDENLNSEKEKEEIRESAIETLTNQAQAAGLSDFDISKEDSMEGEKQIRVTFPSSSKVAAEAVLSLLESDCELSFRKGDDTSLLEKGTSAYDALLTTYGDKAEVTTDSNGNIAIQLNLSHDGLKEFNSWITDGDLEKIPEDDTENPNAGGTEDVIIWFGYTEYDEENPEDKVDSYEEYKALKENGATFLTSEQRSIYNKYQSKILSVASISASVVNKGGLEDNKFLLTGNFTRAKANSIIDVINNGGLDYSLERETFARINATEGNSSIVSTVIALIVGLLAISIFLVIIYRLPGVGAAFTLLAQVFLSLLVYRAFNGLFGPEIIVALLISVFVGTDTFVCLFERAKDEMFKGKQIERSFDEASKKSTSTLIDATLLSLIVALIIFAVGNGTIRSIATMLAVSMAICLVLSTLLIKLLSNCVYKSLKFEGKYQYFTSKHKAVPNVKQGERQSFFGYFTNVNFFNKLKKIYKFVGCGLLVSVICGGLWFAINGSPFNLSSELSSYTKITIQTNLTSEDVEQGMVVITEDNVESYISEKTGVKPKDVQFIKDKLTENDKVEFMSYVITFSKVVDDEKLESLNTELSKLQATAEALNDNSQSYIEDEYVFTYSLNTTKNVTASKTILNALLAFGLAIAAVFVYTSIRYKFTYALSISAGLLVDAVLVLAALLITHLSFSIVSATCILGILCYSVNDKAMLFDKVRENLRGSRKKVFTYEEYVDYSNKALQQSSLRSIIVGSVSILMLLVIMISSLFNYTLFAIVLSLGIVSSFATTTFLCPIIWVKLENKWTLFMQNKTRTTKKKVKVEELEEQVFIGIND